MLNTLQFFTRAEPLLKTGKRSHHWRTVGRAGERNLITRIGKERVRNIFDVKVVWLTGASGRDRIYEIGPVGGYGVRPAPKNL